MRTRLLASLNVMIIGLMVTTLLTACGPAPRPGAPTGSAAPPRDPAASASASLHAPGKDTAGHPSRDAATVMPTVASPDELVLRWRLTGGLAGRGGPGTLPDFSVYGDGRAIVPDTAAGPEPGPGTATILREYRLTPAAVRRLLADAQAAGLHRPRTVEQPGVADAFTLEITLGSARTRIVVAGPGETDPAVRFWRERLNAGGWARRDQAVVVHPYEVTRLAVLAAEAGTADRERLASWPLAPVGAGAPVAGALCTVISGRDVPRASRLSRTARPGTRWLSEGKAYSVRFRPMLPDERTCADVERT
ncbi:MAG: hypothetical protein JWO67_2843 [Streptosporangiaceae bacterium]|nr:hypothetical protein [Streptosporangiaceae bacterium]